MERETCLCRWDGVGDVGKMVSSDGQKNAAK